MLINIIRVIVINDYRHKLKNCKKNHFGVMILHNKIKILFYILIELLSFLAWTLMKIHWVIKISLLVISFSLM